MRRVAGVLALLLLLIWPRSIAVDHIAHTNKMVANRPNPVHKAEASRADTAETFIATAYCPTGNRCKDGSWPVADKTIAVDPSVIRLGSKVLVDGVEKTATDTGKKVKGRRVDMFVGSEKEANDFGVRLVQVEVEKP